VQRNDAAHVVSADDRAQSFSAVGRRVLRVPGACCEAGIEYDPEEREVPKCGRGGKCGGDGVAGFQVRRISFLVTLREGVGRGRIRTGDLGVVMPLERGAVCRRADEAVTIPNADARNRLR
jgi:hypothetical protein